VEGVALERGLRADHCFSLPSCFLPFPFCSYCLFSLSTVFHRYPVQFRIIFTKLVCYFTITGPYLSIVSPPNTLPRDYQGGFARVYTYTTHPSFPRPPKPSQSEIERNSKNGYLYGGYRLPGERQAVKVVPHLKLSVGKKTKVSREFVERVECV
jgi:hypothetical protein